MQNTSSASPPFTATRRRRATFVLWLALAASAACVSERRRTEPVRTSARSRTEGTDERTPVRALPALAEGAGLNDFVRYAELRNPGLEAVWSEWRAAEARAEQVDTLPDPMLTYQYFVDEVETRVGPQNQSFGLSQSVPGFGKRRQRGEQADSAACEARARYELARLALGLEVRSAYFELHYLARAIDVLQRSLELVERLEAVARSRYTAGSAEYADVIRAQVELGTLDDRLRSLRELRRPLSARMNEALNRSPDAPLPAVPATPSERLDASDEQVYAWLETESPELLAERHRIEAAEHGVELARRAGSPDFEFGLRYIDTGGALAPGVPDSGKDPLSVSVSLNLPLHRERYAAAEREAEALLRAAVLRSEARRNGLRSRAAAALYKVRDAERKLVLHEGTLVPLATMALEATEVAYRAGEATFTELIEAERLLLELELGTERALADHGQQRAELERLVGRAVPFRSEPDADPAASDADFGTANGDER